MARVVCSYLVFANKVRGETAFGGGTYLHDNCAVSISVCVCVCVCVRTCVGEDSPLSCMCMLFYSVVWLHSIVALRIGLSN